MDARSGSWLHVALYRSLYVVLALSTLGFALSFKYADAWEAYKRIYFFVIVGYIWYTFILLFLGERRKQPKYEYDGGSIAVLMPVFNEEPKLFLKALQSVLRCKGNKKIFVLDDGSTKPMNREALRALCNKYGVVLHFFPKNRGKRHVLTDGVVALNKKFDYVVTIDSDTILDENALVNIVSVFADKKVGAASGEVRLLNERKNWLTRMVAAYYWIALDICKQSQSTFGFVACCSGCLSAYRGELVDKVIEEYGNQMFAGELCSHSEDRHLTNLILREGYQVKFVSSAISYTYTPETIPAFLKQQMRWKRAMYARPLSC